MAIVLALVIIGWLLAFALGAQAGFDTQTAKAESTRLTTADSTPATYQKTSAA